MELRVRELADRLGGRSIEGDAELVLRGVAALEAGAPDRLGFVRSPHYASLLAGSRIGAVIAPAGLAVGARTVIRSPAPGLDFARAAALLAPPPRPPAGVHPRAFVAPSAQVAASASVGPLAAIGERARIGARSVVGANACVLEDAVVGEDCELHAGVVLGARCALGDRVILQAGCVIGGDGFGYEFDERGALQKVPQLGDVVIEDDVEIGANATVDRARLGSTRIGRGAKIDNLVQVAHNVEIGAHSVVIAQSGIAGSARLGERVFLMAQSGVGDHIAIGAGSFVGARGGVIEDSGAREPRLRLPGRRGARLASRELLAAPPAGAGAAAARRGKAPRPAQRSRGPVSDRRERLDELRERAAASESSAALRRLAGRLRADPRAGARRVAEDCVRWAEELAAERRRLAGLFARRARLLRAGARMIAGVDEVGVGPLAGPVVAGAVVFAERPWLPGLDDSKKLSATQRERLAGAIRAQAAAVAIAEVWPDEIDRLNVYRAALEAMRRAVVALAVAPDHVLVDARVIPGIAAAQTPLIGGDGRDGSIAAASIVAKVHRDALMDELDARHPGYGFARHKGYATGDHLAALRALGPSPLHRRSFTPVSQPRLF